MAPETHLEEDPMSIADPPSLPRTMTAEELMALPDDGIEREIIRGDLRETPTTVRNITHSGVEANIVYFLKAWLIDAGAGGKVHGGEAGFRLQRTPESLVGIDVALAPGDLVESTSPKSTYHDGAPTLAVVVRSPSDVHEKVVEKVDL